MRRKKEKTKVHFICEVGYEKKYTLIPGQALPIRLLQGEEERRDVEIKIHASLWREKDVYTDVSPSPLTLQYIRDMHLGELIHVHSTKDGFGTTVLRPEGQSPGAFAKAGRTVFPSSIAEIMTLEDQGTYVAGPACYAHLIPGIYARLTPDAPIPDNAERMWDIGTGEVGTFVRLPLPVVLGAFDTFHRQTWWQTELMRRAFAPYEETVPLLYDLLEDAEIGGKMGVFDCENYFYALPSPGPREGKVEQEKVSPKIAILPYTNGDAWAGIDLGRKHVKDWREVMRYLYKA